MRVDYTIVSESSYIWLMCPHCKQGIEIPFNKVCFNTDYWCDGGWCFCSECGAEIELGDYDYE